MFSVSATYYLGPDGKATTDPTAGPLVLSCGAVISDERAIKLGLKSGTTSETPGPVNDGQDPGFKAGATVHGTLPRTITAPAKTTITKTPKGSTEEAA